MKLQDMNETQLKEFKSACEKEYNDFKALNLKLDMSRGKPSKDQLDLSMGMFDCLTSKDAIATENGVDCRNYGVLASGVKNTFPSSSVVNTVKPV